MFDKVPSKNGKYEYLIQVDKIELLGGQYNFAAKLLSVTDRESGRKLTGVPMTSEGHGVWPNDAIDEVAAEANEILPGA